MFIQPRPDLSKGDFPDRAPSHEEYDLRAD